MTSPSNLRIYNDSEFPLHITPTGQNAKHFIVFPNNSLLLGNCDGISKAKLSDYDFKLMTDTTSYSTKMVKGKDFYFPRFHIHCNSYRRFSL